MVRLLAPSSHASDASRDTLAFSQRLTRSTRSPITPNAPANAKKQRKAIQRRTVDYFAPLMRWIETRAVVGDEREAAVAVEPDGNYLGEVSERSGRAGSERAGEREWSGRERRGAREYGFRWTEILYLERKLGFYSRRGLEKRGMEPGKGTFRTTRKILQFLLARSPLDNSLYYNHQMPKLISCFAWAAGSITRTSGPFCRGTPAPAWSRFPDATSEFWFEHTPRFWEPTALQIDFLGLGARCFVEQNGASCAMGRSPEQSAAGPCLWPCLFERYT